jgi:hypothetical protein
LLEGVYGRTLPPSGTKRVQAERVVVASSLDETLTAGCRFNIREVLREKRQDQKTWSHVSLSRPSHLLWEVGMYFPRKTLEGLTHLGTFAKMEELIGWSL